MARRGSALKWAASINKLVAGSLADVKQTSMSSIVKSASMSTMVKSTSMDMFGKGPSMLLRRGLTTETSKTQHKAEQYQQMGRDLPSK